jgi:hypothetical protein
MTPERRLCLWSVYREFVTVVFGAAIGVGAILLYQHEPQQKQEPPKAKPQKILPTFDMECDPDAMWWELLLGHARVYSKYQMKRILIHSTMTGEGLVQDGRNMMWKSHGIDRDSVTLKAGYWVKFNDFRPPVGIGEKFDVVVWATRIGNRDMIFEEVQ